MADDDAVARGKEAAAVHDQWNVGKVYKKPLFAAGFYLTWFGLRLGCPSLLRVFDEEVRALGFAPWEFNYVRAVGSHAVICALNYFWTFEMGYKMLLPKKSKQG